jgi:uncharacterized protein (TIGR02466 family)
MPHGPADEIDLSQSVILAYATPLVIHQWSNTQALDAALAALLRGLEANSPGVTHSNVGSWHSALDLLNQTASAIRDLNAMILALGRSMTRAITHSHYPEADRSVAFTWHGWGNITRAGGYNSAHTHPGSFWSGVYYVDPGDPVSAVHPMSGRLEFFDPRAGVKQSHLPGTMLDSRYLIDPKPGMMLLFPSWLLHCVHPYWGQSDRISIAFNMSLANTAQRQSD